MKWILLVLGALLAIGCGDSTPRRSGDEGSALPRWRDEGRDVALVVNAGATDDLRWVDVLAGVFGTVDVLDTATTDDWMASMADRSVVWIGRETLRRVRPTDLPFLDGFVRAGGALVLETPDSTWAPGAGLRVVGAERLQRAPWPLERGAAQLFGDGRGAGLSARRGAFRPLTTGHLPDRFGVALSVRRYAPARDRSAAARPWTRAAGRPAVWSRAVDGGAIISIAYELARFHDEATNAGPRPLPAPVIDAWMSRLLESEAAPSPWPRWSVAPFGSDGVVCRVDDVAAAEGFHFGTTWPLGFADEGATNGIALATARPASASEADLVTMLARNAQVGAGVVAMPSGIDSIRVASASVGTDHRVMSRNELDVWWAARAATRVAWSRIDDLNVRVETPPLELELSFGLLLPATWRDEVLVGWNASWPGVASRRVVRAGRTWIEIAVPPATEGNLRVSYRPRR